MDISLKMQLTSPPKKKIKITLVESTVIFLTFGSFVNDSFAFLCVWEAETQ